MTFPIPAGNYLSEVWPTVIGYVQTNDVVGYHHYISNIECLKIDEDAPCFLLIDIHGFSKLCNKFEENGHSDEIVKFLLAFFYEMSKHIYRKDVTTVKFIGDSILARHKEKDVLITLANELLKIYRDAFVPTYSGTDLVAFITCPKILLKGFACGLDYVDYSYWGSGLNYMFYLTKILPQGHVYFIREDGTHMPCDLF